MKLFTFRAVALTAFGLFILLSCKKDVVNGLGKKDKDPVLREIFALGYQMKDIREFPNYYLVDGDIRFDRNPKSATKQASHSSLISYSNQSNINIFLNTSSFSNFTVQVNMATALNNVVNAYNAIPNCNIQMNIVPTSSGANITIQNAVIGGSVCGEGTWPSSSLPGSLVRIDQSFMISTGFTDVSRLTFLLAHEIGHNLGLRHTNWSAAGEPTATTIASTPSSDASSVMNSGTCGNTWSALSAMDTRAVQVLYPEKVNSFWGSGMGTASQVLKGDFNGDGRTDLVQISLGNSYMFLSSGSSLTSSGLWGTGHGSPSELRAEDLNGDGKTDLVQFAASGSSYVWLSTGSGFSYQGLWGTGHGTASGILMADLNGDGKKDVIQMAGSNSYVWLSTGSAFSAQGLWGTGHGGISEVKVIDFDGDGKQELVQVSASGNSYVWRSTGTGFSALGLTGTGHGSAPNVLTADFNNDGKSDLMQVSSGNAYVWLSNGSSFVSSGLWATGVGTASEIKILDMNGDGRDDIMQMTSGVSFRWLSTGTGFGSFRFWSSGHGSFSENFIGKFDANATEDVIQVSASGNAYMWSSF